MNGDPQSDEIIERIIDDAHSLSVGSASLLSLEELADKLDLLTSDFGRWNEYKAASVEYIQAFTSEVTWHARIRMGVAVAAALLVLFLSTVLVVAIINASALFGSDSGHALTALIAATVTGTVVIVIAATRGAFTTLADRNAGLPMPEHIKELVDVGKSMLSGEAR